MVDLQIFATPRITLKPLVPSFPCFAKILVSLMDKVCEKIKTNFSLDVLHESLIGKLLARCVTIQNVFFCSHTLTLV